MAWSAYRTWVAGDVLTAAQLNQDIRDNGNLLLPTTANTAGAETTTSTSYGDLSGGATGPAVTVTTGTKALVIVSAQMVNNGANVNRMGYAVSGATTRAAADTEAALMTGTSNITPSLTSLVTGLTAGSNTFTAKYKVSGGTGTFTIRNITVWPYNS